MNIFFTGCTHINHDRIIELCQRPFQSIDEHDNYLINQINITVNKNDRLYLLGDIGAFKNINETKDFRKKINCSDVRLVIGNHDPLSMTAYKGIFQQAGDILEYVFGTEKFQRIIMCHYSMLVWNQSFRGSYHCYSHTHAKIESLCDQIMPQRRSLDVGVDNAARLFGEYRPFSLDEIISLLKYRTGNSLDRFSFRITKCEKISHFEYRVETDCNLLSISEINQQFVKSNRYLILEKPDCQKFPLWFGGNLWHVRIEAGTMVFQSKVDIPLGTIGFWGQPKN